MPDRKIVEFDNIRLEPADNGFVLEYTEVSESQNSMDSRDWNSRQMVFLDGDESIGIDLALAKMKEMYMFNRMRKGGTDHMTTPSTHGSVLKAS